MSQRFTSRIWVSYASAELVLVESLGQHVQQATVTKEKQYSLCAYLDRTSKTSSLQGYLRADELIQFTIESIATSLRRVIILSPAYLNSEHCLWELCCCLTYSSNNIFLILADIADMNLFSKKGLLSYYDHSLTLVEALCQVYENHVQKMHDSFLLPVDQSPELFFSEKINLMANQIHVTYNQSITVNELSDMLLNYAETFNITAVNNQFLKFLESCFDQWIERSFAEVLLANGKVITFGMLLDYQSGKIGQIVDELIDGYHRSPTSDSKMALCQFAGILALLRLDPEWVAEMRAVNPGGQFFRISVPEDYNDKVRVVYEVNVAAHAIQFAPITLYPSVEGIPDVDGILNIALPPEVVCDAREREQRKDKLINELVSRVMVLKGDELKHFFALRNWKARLRAVIKLKHCDENGILTVARFYIDQTLFIQKGNSEAVALIREIMEEINEGATPNRLVKIGITQVMDKDDSGIVYSQDEDLLQVHITDLLDAKGYYEKTDNVIKQQNPKQVKIDDIALLTLTFRMVLDRWMSPDLLVKFEHEAFTAALTKHVGAGDVGEQLLKAQSMLNGKQAGVAPNPLWLAWIKNTQGQTIEQFMDKYCS